MRKKILSSRVDSTKLLVDSLAQLKKKPKLLLSASAVGFYGYDDAESLFDESAGTKGNGWLLLDRCHTCMHACVNALRCVLHSPLDTAYCTSYKSVCIINWQFFVGYLAEVCEQWEQQALRADKELGIRTVCLRFAPILSSRAGLLAKLLPIFGLGVG